VSAEFVSLAQRLARIEPRVGDAPCESSPLPETSVAEAPEAWSTSCAVPPQLGSGVADALRDARLFRARLADAFAEAAQRLLRELACEVLARELRVAPCDLAALVQRVRERVPVVRVRVAAADLGAVTGVPLVADPALQPGDAIVELAGGALDARLGVRLAAVLEAFP